MTTGIRNRLGRALKVSNMSPTELKVWHSWYAGLPWADLARRKLANGHLSLIQGGRRDVPVSTVSFFPTGGDAA